jgi:hypothetical protein
MTTPRVYTVSLDNPKYSALAGSRGTSPISDEPIFIRAEVILLSDHKEVVKGLEEVNGVLKTDRNFWISESERLESELTEAKAKLGEAVERITEARDVIFGQANYFALEGQGGTAVLLHGQANKLIRFLNETKTATQGEK